jgi:hypothetical protein
MDNPIHKIVNRTARPAQPPAHKEPCCEFFCDGIEPELAPALDPEQLGQYCLCGRIVLP